MNEHLIERSYNKHGLIVSLRSSLGAEPSYARNAYGKLVCFRANEAEIQRMYFIDAQTYKTGTYEGISKVWMNMEQYKRLAYLLGCYIVVSDQEINALEVDVLDAAQPLDESDPLCEKRQLIFSDDESKPKLGALLDELRLLNITFQEKCEVVHLLVDIAYGDDYVSKEELQLLRKVAKILGVSLGPWMSEAEAESKKRIEAQRLSRFKRIMGKTENIIHALSGSKGKVSVINQLLGGLGYATSVEEITNTALSDLDRVAGVVGQVNASLITTSSSLEQLMVSFTHVSKELKPIVDIITKVKAHFDDLIDVSLKENELILEKKRKNIRYFTIAFMGRTKAGKSTLHKVITQQERDDIGVGKLRTTRFNRSWYWNRLRVVDTPGIGSPGGVADTEIAKSIIDEADVICYVVTNDSIQETEFDFFSTIKERNKPLYIILNVKSNLTQTKRLMHFLEHPSAWKDSIGSSSIQGHLDRIRERLEGKYNMDAVEVIPIHLLAAQLGFFGEYSKKDSQKLREGSNLFAFTRSVQSSVAETGGLKKSLSVIDGTAYQLHEIVQTLHPELSDLKSGRKQLAAHLKRFRAFMEIEGEWLIKNIHQEFELAKSALKNRASAFASENYDRKDADVLWGKDQTVKSIYSQLNTRLQQRQEDFNDKVKAQIDEVIHDIQILESFRAESSISGASIENPRLAVNIIGAICSAVSPFIVANLWHPGGWVLGAVAIGVGLVFSCLSSLFTSKRDKIREATAKMRDQLTENIDKSLSESEQSYLQEVERAIDLAYHSVVDLLSTHLAGIDGIIYEIQTLFQEVVEAESALNALVGFRLLGYVGKTQPKGIELLDNHTIASRYPVSRDWGKQTIAYNYNPRLATNEIKRISQAVQMNIIVK